MKTNRKNWIAIIGIGGTGALVLATAIAALAQTAPVLRIAPTGTNVISVTITNNIGTLDYDLEWNSVLGNSNFLWTFAAIGVPGGTNFLLNQDTYPATFFRAVLDTNVPPLWQSSNPSVPGSPVLSVTILSPANGSTINQ